MQGFNMGRYVPPEYEGTVSGNKLAGKHALGARARKAGQGILTVRFEMPFAIWCTTCPRETIIGQGVRFNAEKKKVGNYYSSSIYSFRMKHADCGGWIEIRTDPQNTAYVVTEGARKRDTGDDVVKEGDVEVLSKEEREKMREDAFAALEVTIEDRAQATQDKNMIEGLLDMRDRDWDDPYAANQRLRKAFRVGRKEREKDATAAEEIKDRLGLGIELLAESEDDRRRAGFVDFGNLEDASEKATTRRVQAKSMFSPRKSEKPKPSRSEGKLKSDVVAEGTRERLRQELGQNTRAAIDPFLSSTTASHWKPAGVKRKHSENEHIRLASAGSISDSPAASALVDYDSD